MAELAGEHCKPCKGGVAAYTEAEAAELAARVPEWTLEAAALRREFKFPDFLSAFALVAKVAQLAESEGHHPDIELGWGRAAFTLTTHAAGGLTRNDFILAAKIDRLSSGS